MSTLNVEVVQVATTKNIAITEDMLTVELSDGRTISAPLAWYPRLLHGTPMERNTWRLIGNGEGIHWPDLDEDISVENLVLGRRSGESQRSFKEWVEKRKPITDQPKNC
jgi:hypothetical protein